MKLADTEKKIVRILFTEGATSRKNLASILNVSKAATTQICSNLLSLGLIKESGEVTSGKVGRKELLITLNEKAFVIFGLEIKRNEVTFSITDFIGNKLYFKKFTSLDLCLSEVKKLKRNYDNILGLNVLIRGFVDEEKFASKDPSSYKKIKSLNLETYFLNNVLALGYIYHMYNYDKNNFLLIKYGPGVGSCIFVDGKPLKSKEGIISEIGHTFINDHLQLENAISFTNIVENPDDEKKGADEIFADQDKLNLVLNSLALAIVNADSLLSLENIILTGYFFSNPMALQALKMAIADIDHSFHVERLIINDKFSDINDVKSCISLVYLYFCTDN